jgi:hypothetical protein
MRHLFDSADTLFRLVAGVGRPAGNLDLEHAHTFPAGLQRALGSGPRLEAKDVGTLSGLFFNY